MIILQRAVGQFWNNLVGTLATFNPVVDLIDIFLVATIIYYALKLVRETRAVQLVKSIAVIFAVYFIADMPLFDSSMITLRFFIGKVLDSGLVVLVVLFQPELRRALEQIGRSKIADISLFQSGNSDDDNERNRELINILCESCEKLSASRTGALIVVERETRLGDIINTGTVIDSRASEELIGNIFFTNSPLHDGAMVVRKQRLYAAGCFLPLSDNQEIARELGTRHRAALGMSEVSDALVLIVSEETGNISVAFESRIQRALSVQNLRKLLNAKLIGLPDKNGRKRRFGRGKA